MKQNITKFDIGKSDIVDSTFDTGARWKFKVISRTDKTITVSGDFPGRKQTKILRITVIPAGHYGMLEESCKPLGSYSMCPILRATATTENFKIMYGY